MPVLAPWEVFADAIVARAARQRLTTWGQPFDAMAGAAVSEGDVGRLLAELPSAAGERAPAGDLDAAVAAARATLHDRRGDDQFSALVRYAELDDVSAEVLALAAGVGWHPVRARLLGYAQDDLAARGAMVALLPSLLGRPDAIAAAAPDSTLRRSCLVEVHADASAGSASVTVPLSVQWHLIGDASRDPGLPHDTREYEGMAAPSSAPHLGLVHGPDRVRRLQAAAHVAGTTRMIVTGEPATAEQWAAVVRVALCRMAVVMLELDSVSAATRHWVSRTWMVPWIVSSRFPIPLPDLPSLPFHETEVDHVPVDETEVRAVLGDVPAGHRLTAEQLHVLSRLDSVEASQAVRRLASGELDHLARRTRPRRTWDELVLPPDRLAQVKEVAIRVRHRTQVFDEWGFRAVPSAGVLALFAGPSGTGKTMSAEIVAGELGLDMFKVDLSSLVSKYIGETEKNLERVFGAAEGGGVVLVFDEADAVFGKRTQVSDAQDRYANIETSYLLQRLESYDGLVVLTSNYAGNIDQAFMRRIHVSVEFPMPEEAERLAIWRASFPATAPVGEIDFAFLAERFKLAGGSIRAAALTGAFLAADSGTPVAMRHVVQGVRREYQKLGRIVAPGEFGDWLD